MIFTAKKHLKVKAKQRNIKVMIKFEKHLDMDYSIDNQQIQIYLFLQLEIFKNGKKKKELLQKEKMEGMIDILIWKK